MGNADKQLIQHQARIIAALEQIIELAQQEGRVVTLAPMNTLEDAMRVAQDNAMERARIEQVQIFNAEIAPLMDRYNGLMRELTGVVGRIDELAQLHRFVPKEAFNHRLHQLSGELSKVATRYRNLVGEMSSDGIEIGEADAWIQTARVVLDTIAQYFKGEKPVEDLAALYSQLPGNQGYAEVLKDVRIRKRGRDPLTTEMVRAVDESFKRLQLEWDGTGRKPKKQDAFKAVADGRSVSVETVRTYYYKRSE